MAAPRATAVARYTVSGSIFPDEYPVIDNYRIVVCRPRSMVVVAQPVLTARDAARDRVHGIAYAMPSE